MREIGERCRIGEKPERKKLAKTEEERAKEAFEEILDEAFDSGQLHVAVQLESEARPEDICKLLDIAHSRGWELADRCGDVIILRRRSM